MNTIRPIAALTILLGLAACSGDDDAPAVSSEPYCPRPTIVSELQQTEGPSVDGQVTWAARLTNLASICDSREFDYTVEMDVTIDLRTSPAYAGGAVNLAYFVAVATPSGEVIDKQTFPVILEPARGERRALRRETLRQRLPLTYGGDREAGAERATWSVLVGFEPTAAQVRERTEAPPSADATAPAAPGSGQ
jgi:hypothetical protein